MKPDQIRISVNVFVVKDNKILLGKRKGGTGEGFWGLPGGHLEYMEHLTTGALRELAEETGLKPASIEIANITNEPLQGDKTHYIHFNFLTKDITSEPILMEPNRCFGWQWFDLKNLPKSEELFIGHRRSIEMFAKGTFFAD